MSPAQTRAARGLLGLTEQQLADMADLSVSTIVEFERGRPVHDGLVATIQVALEAAGVDFIPEKDSGQGVRLRKAAIDV